MAPPRQQSCAREGRLLQSRSLSQQREDAQAQARDARGLADLFEACSQLTTVTRTMRRGTRDGSCVLLFFTASIASVICFKIAGCGGNAEEDPPFAARH